MAEYAMRQFTKIEVSQNNGQQNSRVWIIIKKSVYDVTDYINVHPGGADLLLEYAGKDATNAFIDTGHSSDANKQMQKYKIGVLKQESKVITSELGSKDKQNKKSRRRIFLRAICGRCTV